MTTNTLEALHERVNLLSQKKPEDFASEDCHEANNIKYVCLGIVENYTRPCEDRIMAAEIAIAAIELKTRAIMEQARQFGQARCEARTPVTVRLGGRVLKHAA